MQQILPKRLYLCKIYRVTSQKTVLSTKGKNVNNEGLARQYPRISMDGLRKLMILLIITDSLERIPNSGLHKYIA
jgi:hypothetical protein